MIKELITIKKILEDSEIDFRIKVPSNYEDLIYMPLNYILDDYVEMSAMLWDIQRIIDKMIQEGDENKNIDKLIQERNVNQFFDELLQEGEDNEL